MTARPHQRRTPISPEEAAARRLERERNRYKPDIPTRRQRELANKRNGFR